MDFDVLPETNRPQHCFVNYEAVVDPEGDDRMDPHRHI